MQSVASRFGFRSRFSRASSLALVLALGVGCSKSTSPSSAGGAGGASSTGSFTLTTDSFTVPAGAEEYLCYAQTLTEDLAVDQFTYDTTPVVHHMLVARTLAPEPNGLSVCNVLFKTSWVPLFGAGKGDASLVAPSGNGYVLPKGTQMLFQLHLLNTTTSAVTEKATVRMGLSPTPNPSPVGIYAFGTEAITLPPHQTTSIVNDCTTSDDVEAFEWYPHMHQLGTAISLQVGTSANDLKTVYEQGPWNFNDQHMDAKSIHIPAGSFTRTTCTYTNPGADTVSFGETSADEMCYLVSFVTNPTTSLNGCVNQTPPSDGGTGDGGPPDYPTNPDAGACGAQTANSKGIGAACTQGGNECASGLTCSLDQGSSPPGFCLEIGSCKTSADCGGGGATCCAPAEGGGLIDICIPEACRPTDCKPM